MIRSVHRVAAFAAPTIIALFWLSTVAAELFGTPTTVATVKLAIAWCLPLLAAVMATVGISGKRLAGESSAPEIVAKQKRMKLIAANGTLVLIPCALFLAVQAAAGQFDVAFAIVQGIELVAGPVNLVLVAMNARAGFAMTARRLRAV